MSTEFRGWTNYQTAMLKAWIDKQHFLEWRFFVHVAYRSAKGELAIDRLRWTISHTIKRLQERYAELDNEQVNWLEIAESLVLEVSL